jgi:hypothetical protein
VGRGAGGTRQDLPNGGGKPGSGFGDPVAEQIRGLDGCQGAAAAEVAVRDDTFIKADWDKPWDLRAAQPELVYSEDEFLVLVALVAAQAVTGEANDEGQGVIGDRGVSSRASPRQAIGWPYPATPGYPRFPAPGAADRRAANPRARRR